MEMFGQVDLQATCPPDKQRFFVILSPAIINHLWGGMVRIEKKIVPSISKKKQLDIGNEPYLSQQ